MYMFKIMGFMVCVQNIPSYMIIYLSLKPRAHPVLTPGDQLLPHPLTPNNLEKQVGSCSHLAKAWHWFAWYLLYSVYPDAG